MEMNNLMDLGGGVGWAGTLLIGAVAGWIAEKLTRSDMGLIMNIIVGIIGAYIGPGELFSNPVAALFGFGGIAAGAAGIAKILFLIFLVLFAVSLVMGLLRRG